MDPFLDALTLEQLEGDSREFAEVIGMEPIKKLVAVYGGSGVLYIPNLVKLRTGVRDRQLIREYQGGVKIGHLARKYQISERRVRQIILKYNQLKKDEDIEYE